MPRSKVKTEPPAAQAKPKYAPTSAEDRIKLGLIPAPPDADLSLISPDLRHAAVRIDTLHLDTRNPRQGDVDLVASSLREYGQQKTIAVFRFPGNDFFTVIAGNHTTRAAIKNGWTYIAANEFVGPPTDAQRYALMDNRSSDVATYNDTTLVEVLTEIQGNLADDRTMQDATGYSSDDLTYLLSRIPKGELVAKGGEQEYQGEIQEVLDEIGEPSDATDGVMEYRGYHLFPTEYRWGLPDLLPDMFAEPPDKPIKTWPGQHYADKDWEGYWFVIWG